MTDNLWILFAAAGVMVSVIGGLSLLGKNLPETQGLMLGSISGKRGITALVDTDDVHCLMIGASGVGKLFHAKHHLLSLCGSNRDNYLLL